MNQHLFQALICSANVLSHTAVRVGAPPSLAPSLLLSVPRKDTLTHTHTHTSAHTLQWLHFFSGSVQRAKANSHTLILGSKRCFNSIRISQVTSEWAPRCLHCASAGGEQSLPRSLLLTNISGLYALTGVVENNTTQICQHVRERKKVFCFLIIIKWSVFAFFTLFPALCLLLEQQDEQLAILGPVANNLFHMWHIIR